MRITWLGESGFILESGNTRILLDPYLSNSLGICDPAKSRILPVQENFLSLNYDLLLFTHWHVDHTDTETVKLLLKHNNRLLMAGPCSSYNVVRPFIQSAMFFKLTIDSVVRSGDFEITALPAIHSDQYALGFKICVEEKTLYFSGDTALLCGLQERVPKQPDIAFLCFNGGMGKNMDISDALRLSKEIRPKLVVPAHYGIIPSGTDVVDFIRAFEKEGIFVQLPEYCNSWSI